MKLMSFLLPNIVALIASLAITNNAAAAGRTFYLDVKNNEEVPLTITISAKGHNCYEPNPEGLPGTIKTIAPGSSYGWWINRRQGHGCDGEQGVFMMTFDPYLKDGAKRDTTCFTFDNAMHLGINNGCVNQYQGTLVKTDSDKYQYQSSGLVKKLSAVRQGGEWELICSGVCDRSTMKSTSETKSESKTLSTQQTNAIASSLKITVKDPIGIDVEGSVSSSSSKTLGKVMADSFSRGETNTDTSKYSRTAQEMKEMNIQAMWQWVEPMHLSDGTKYVVRSNLVTCTSNSLAPSYGPTDPRANQTCTGSLINM